MDKRTERIAKAICGFETNHRRDKTECKACREAHFDGDKWLPEVADGCKGLGYEHLADVVIAADVDQPAHKDD